MSALASSRRPAASRHLAGGFTLIELVVAIVLSAVVVGFATMFMTAPVDAYFAQSRRSQLVDSSDAITRALAADLRHALPKSVRIRNSGSRSIVELLLVEKIAFYRGDGTGTGIDSELKIGSTDNEFAALGSFGLGAQTPLQPNYHLAIGNLGTGTGAAGRNAYRQTNVMTRNESITLAAGGPGEDLVTLSPAFRFVQDDPSKQVFLVSGPVTYICNSAANARTLRKYSGYPVTAGIPTAETSPQLSAPGAINTVVATDVSSCLFRCDSGSTAPCNNALVVNIGISKTGNAANEIIRVFAQLPVDNRL